MRSIFPRAILIAAALAAGCSDAPWNYPYSTAERSEKILYSVFVDRPKHLDPAQSYTTDEAVFTRQIYEPPLQYHYLKRPYELVPLTAVAVPRPHTITRGGATYSVYEIRIRPGIHYQPHPAFNPEHLSLTRSTIDKLRSPYDLPGHTTRELVADDVVYSYERLASSPKLIRTYFDHVEKVYARDTHTGWVAGRRADDFSLDLDHARELIAEHRPHVVLLPSPNNPTGTALDIDAITALCDAAGEQAIVVVDEAYGEFRRAGTPSALDLLPSRRNLVVTRTMSKAFAGAGGGAGG